jgi:hypothetical protein
MYQIGNSILDATISQSDQSAQGEDNIIQYEAVEDKINGLEELADTTISQKRDTNVSDIVEDKTNSSEQWKTKLTVLNSGRQT